MTSKEFMKAYIDGVCICARWGCRWCVIRRIYTDGFDRIIELLIMFFICIRDLIVSILSILLMLALILFWPIWKPLSWLWFSWRRRDVVEQCRKLLKGTPQ